MPAIQCPICHTSEKLLLEPPRWTTAPAGKPEEAEYIRVSNYCTHCGVHFDTVHKIGRAIITSNIQSGDY